MPVQLPPELLSAILSFSTEPRALFASSLVSRSWSHAALARLYNSLDLRLECAGEIGTGGSLSSVLRGGFLSYASLVRKVNLSIVWPSFEYEDESVEDLIEKLETEVAALGSLAGHLVALCPANRPIGVRVEIAIGVSKSKKRNSEERDAKLVALERVIGSARSLLDSEAPGKMELVISSLRGLDVGIPEHIVALDSWISDLGVGELCSFQGNLNPLFARQLKRTTLCGCHLVAFNSTISETNPSNLTHLCVTRCLESPVDAVFDNLATVLPRLGSLKSLELALPNTAKHVYRLFSALDGVNALNTLHLDFYPAPESNDVEHSKPPALPVLRNLTLTMSQTPTRRSAIIISLHSAILPFFSAQRQLRTLDLNYSPVSKTDLDTIFPSVGQSLESISLVGCRNLPSPILPEITSRLLQAANPLALREVRMDLGDPEAALSELRDAATVNLLRQFARTMRRVHTFTVLGPSSADFAWLRAQAEGGDVGAGLLQLNEGDGEEMEFGDGFVRLDLKKLRAGK